MAKPRKNKARDKAAAQAEAYKRSQKVKDRDRQTIAILTGAGGRLRECLDKESCECDREGRQLGSFPRPAEGRWCLFCATEAEQLALRADGAAYGVALTELAFDLSGEVYSAADAADRDGFLMPWFEESTAEEISEAIAATVGRLNRLRNGDA
jgi:hypothetical protein